ncbi:hypothetical protein [Bacillus safensis]|uniref:Uncharacterized protein n=1 Tax=Bacillus safensis TaxID=561879 RepID=A0A1L6ZJA6_BACIA|nr:hypothetical protein [Bacillus safensis]APT46615.1 hypothetical protein BSA145_12625 [Bacillus safensis]
MIIDIKLNEFNSPEVLQAFSEFEDYAEDLYMQWLNGAELLPDQQKIVAAYQQEFEPKDYIEIIEETEPIDVNELKVFMNVLDKLKKAGFTGLETVLSQ